MKIEGTRFRGKNARKSTLRCAGGTCEDCGDCGDCRDLKKYDLLTLSVGIYKCSKSEKIVYAVIGTKKKTAERG